MSSALTLAVLAALTLSGLLRCCLPGELLHRFAGPAYEWAQLHRPAWIPEKLTWCVFCASFWLAGLPVAAVSAFWLGWWVLAIPLPLAYLTEYLTRPLFPR